MEEYVDRTPRDVLRKNHYLDNELRERARLRLSIKLIEKKIIALDAEIETCRAGAALDARLKVRKSWSSSWDYQNRQLKKVEEIITKARKSAVFG